MSNLPDNSKQLDELNSAENPESAKTTEYDESLFEGSTVFSAPQPTEKKREPKLKPATRGFIISAVAVLLTAAIALTVWLIPYTEDPLDPISSEAPSWTVVKLAEKKVESLDVFNKHGEMNIYIPEDKKASSSQATSSDASSASGEAEGYDWCVKGYEDYNLTGAMYLLQSSINIRAIKQLKAEEGEMLADDLAGKLDGCSFEGQDVKLSDDEKNLYGFTQPYAILNVNGVDEKDSYTVIIGAYAPDNSGRYVTVTGDKHVYVCSNSGFSLGRYSFDTTVADLVYNGIVTTITETDANTDYFVDGSLTFIDELTFTGSCRDNKIVVESAPEELSAMAFVATKPSFRACNDDNIYQILDVYTQGLFSKGAYTLGYTDADLVKYGLNEPYSKIEVKIGGYIRTLTFGKAIDNYYPCIVDNSNIIYKVAVDENEWIAYTNKSIFFDSLFLEFIANISQLTVITEEKEVEFNFVRENKTDGTDFDVEVPGYEDLEIETQEMCFYYSRILSLSAEEYTDDSCPTDSPYISFKIKYINENKSEDLIELHRYSTRRYFFTLNGEGNALVAASTVQDLYNCLDTLLAGEKIGRANI